MLDDPGNAIPFPVAVAPDRPLLWCSCGLSRTQPWCDNSHRGTTARPLAYRAPASFKVVLCGCKRTANPPYCDGSHMHAAPAPEGKPAMPPEPSRETPEDGAFYFVRTKTGIETVAKYIGKHALFFAVGDAIGYFPGDLEAVGRRISFDHAFGE